jgi:hypothetical protein
MKMSHRDAASSLQEKGHLKHWLIALEGSNAIRLTKQFGSTTVSTILLRNAEGMYDLQPFTYTFRSRISFFDYATPENRYARNQIFFYSLFRLLRDVNMWDIISNRDTFLQVNENNAHLKNRGKEIGARLKALTLDAQLVKTRTHQTLTRGHHGNQGNKRRVA